MSCAKTGNRVKVSYTGAFEDGTVFDSSENHGPLEFTLGNGEVILGFEEAVLGMNQGDRKKETIPAEKAYGPYIEELVVDVDKAQFPPDMNPEVGQNLDVNQEDGSVMSVRISVISGDKVTLDANHPLAGVTLVFDIELLEVA